MAVNFVDLAIKKVKDVATSLGKSIVQRTPFADPSSNAGNNFWGGKIAQGFANIQTNMQQARLIPEVKPFNQVGLGQVGNVVANLPGSIFNTVYGKGLVQPTMDVSTNLKQTVQGKPLTDYGQLFSPQARLGYNIMGINRTPKEVLGNVAGTLEPIAMTYGPSAGKNIAANLGKETLLQAVKKGAVSGAKYGVAYGLLSGLTENRQVQDNISYLQGVIGSTVTGGIAGGVLGGGIGAVSNVVGRVFTSIKNRNPKMTDKEVTQETKKFLVDGVWRNQKGQYAVKEPIYYSELRKELGLPENGIEPPQPGLSMKAITPAERAKISTQPKGVGGEGMGVNQNITLQTETQEAIQRVKERVGQVMKTGKTTGKVPVPKTKTELPTHSLQTEDIVNQIDKKTGQILAPEEIIAQKKYFNWFDDIRRRLENEYHPVEKLSNIAQKKGLNLSSWEDPQYLVKRNLGSTGIAEGELLGLGDIVRPVAGQVDDLNAYLVAKRVVGDLSSRNIKTGIDLKDAQMTVDALGPQFEQTAQKLYMYQRSVLHNYLVQTGMLSEESFQKIVGQNPNYVPFQRLFDEAVGTFVPKKGLSVPIKAIKGSEREILNPLESMIENTYKAVTVGEQNRLWRSVAQIGNQVPDLGITKLKPNFVPVAKVEGQSIFRPSFYNPTPNSISYFENGKRVFYSVPKEIATVYNNLGNSSNILFKLLSIPTKIVRTGATGSNPEFALLRNPIKDQFSALWNSESGYVPFLDLFKGISHYSGKDDLYRQYLLSGGGQSFMVSLDREFKGRTLNELLSGNTIIRKGNLLSKMQDISQFSEIGTRLGEFGRTLERTSDPLKAAKAAREVTVDFGRIGKDTRLANQLIAFLNARVQGTIQAVKSGIKHPTKSALIGLGLGSLPATMLYAHNRQYPEWNDIQDYEKQQNWIVLYGKPGEAKMFEIPKDYIVGQLFGNATENFLTYVDKTDPEAMKKLVDNIGRFLSPIGNAGEILPTAVKPIMEHAFNYNTFLGRQIVPEYQKALPPEAQYNKGTREIAKIVGSRIGISPNVIDNYLYGYLPGIFSETINLVDFALGGNKFTDVKKLPFIRVFSVSGTGKVDQEVQNSYYAIQDKKATLSSIAKNQNYSTEQKKGLIQKQLEEMGNLVNKMNNYIKMQKGETGVKFDKKQTQNVPYNPPGLVKPAQAAETSDMDMLVAKEQFRYSDQQATEVNGKILYKDTNGDVKTINIDDVVKMPETSSYEKLLKQKESYKIVDDILKIPVDQQAKAFESLGISPDDATYYQVAKGANDLKSAYLSDAIANLDMKDRGNLINYLISQRKEVNGDMVLSNTIVDDLYKADIISKTEQTMLKNLRIVGGKPVVKLTGRGKKVALKKVSLATTSKKITAPKIKTMAQLLGSVKLKQKKYKFRRNL